MSQTELADAIGATSLHLSRVLRTLRTAGLITFGGGRLVIYDCTWLAKADKFDPTHLHLRRE